MHSNPLFNVVHRLKQVGCDPCRVEANVWRSRCPACRADGRTLVLTRASLVACGSGKGCNEERILAAIGLPGRQAYDATPRGVRGNQRDADRRAPNTPVRGRCRHPRICGIARRRDACTTTAIH